MCMETPQVLSGNVRGELEPAIPFRDSLKRIIQTAGLDAAVESRFPFVHRQRSDVWTVSRSRNVQIASLVWHLVVDFAQAVDIEFLELCCVAKGKLPRMEPVAPETTEGTIFFSEGFKKLVVSLRIRCRNDAGLKLSISRHSNQDKQFYRWTGVLKLRWKYTLLRRSGLLQTAAVVGRAGWIQLGARSNGGGRS